MALKAIIFDQDGTLTIPTLDFDLIRKEMGLNAGPILEAMLLMPPDERRLADEILHRHELEAAARYELNPGVKDAFACIARHELKTAILTRNQILMVEMLMAKFPFLSFDTIITREDDGPSKPDPYPVRKICDTLGITPQEALMVGDFHFDLLTGKRAGAKTVLITTAPNWQTFSHDADYIIHDMSELIAIIRENI